MSIPLPAEKDRRTIFRQSRDDAVLPAYQASRFSRTALQRNIAKNSET
jgi:hypothetical protein